MKKRYTIKLHATEKRRFVLYDQNHQEVTVSEEPRKLSKWAFENGADEVAWLFDLKESEP
jgi:hypothetical protein